MKSIAFFLLCSISFNCSAYINGSQLQTLLESTGNTWLDHCLFYKEEFSKNSLYYRGFDELKGPVAKNVYSGYLELGQVSVPIYLPFEYPYFSRKDDYFKLSDATSSRSASQHISVRDVKTIEELIQEEPVYANIFVDEEATLRGISKKDSFHSYFINILGWTPDDLKCLSQSEASDKLVLSLIYLKYFGAYVDEVYRLENIVGTARYFEGESGFAFLNIEFESNGKIFSVDYTLLEGDFRAIANGIISDMKLGIDTAKPESIDIQLKKLGIPQEWFDWIH